MGVDYPMGNNHGAYHHPLLWAHMQISTMEGSDEGTMLVLIYGKYVCRETALRRVHAVDSACSSRFYAKDDSCSKTTS